MPSSAHGNLPPGSLEMLILQTLTLDAMHGYAIAQHIERRSEDVFRVEQGSLYPALDRLQRKGWVTSAWQESPTKRRARYYTITDSGREQLREQLARYERISHAMSRVLRPA